MIFNTVLRRLYSPTGLSGLVEYEKELESETMYIIDRRAFFRLLISTRRYFIRFQTYDSNPRLYLRPNFYDRAHTPGTTVVVMPIGF